MPSHPMDSVPCSSSVLVTTSRAPFASGACHAPSLICGASGLHARPKGDVRAGLRLPISFFLTSSFPVADDLMRSSATCSTVSITIRDTTFSTMHPSTPGPASIGPVPIAIAISPPTYTNMGATLRTNVRSSFHRVLMKYLEVETSSCR